MKSKRFCSLIHFNRIYFALLFRQFRFIHQSQICLTTSERCCDWDLNFQIFHFSRIHMCDFHFRSFSTVPLTVLLIIKVVVIWVHSHCLKFVKSRWFGLMRIHNTWFSIQMSTSDKHRSHCSLFTQWEISSLHRRAEMKLRRRIWCDFKYQTKSLVRARHGGMRRGSIFKKLKSRIRARIVERHQRRWEEVPTQTQINASEMLCEKQKQFSNSAIIDSDNYGK